MKLFIDTANVEEIVKANELGVPVILVIIILIVLFSTGVFDMFSNLANFT